MSCNCKPRSLALSRRVVILTGITFLSQSTPEARNLWLRTLTRFADWPRIVLYIDLQNITFSCSLSSLFLQETWKR